MVATEAGLRRLEALKMRAGDDCIGFLFKGAIGTCRGSSPILRPVTDPVPGADVQSAGTVKLYATGGYATVLSDAVFDFDGTFFGRGLTVCWPHRDEGCPGCR